jgi:hypothetical protein
MSGTQNLAPALYSREPITSVRHDMNVRRYQDKGDM